MGHSIRLVDPLFGSVVSLLTTPLGIGPALGGWIAGQRVESRARGTLVGGLAGTLGALPWVWLVYLASAGAIEPIGYHEGGVHLGVNTAAPETFVLWQEVALTGAVGVLSVGFAVAGGLVASLGVDVVGEIRATVRGLD